MTLHNVALAPLAFELIPQTDQRLRPRLHIPANPSVVQHLDGCWIEIIESLPSFALHQHQLGIGQNTQMLHHRKS